MSDIETFSLTEAENERLQKLYPTNFGMGVRYIRTKPGNCFLPADYVEYKDRIRNLKLRHDDAFVLTWPKNGTTWTQDMVWCILNGVDLEKAKSVSPFIRVPFLEEWVVTELPKDTTPDSVIMVENTPSPRTIKSHLPYCLLPENILDQCKVITCLRNPKDTVVSFYHHEKLFKFHNFEGNFAEYFDLFMDDLVIWSSYWDYTLEAWKRKDHPNLCLLFFEDMKADLEGCIRKVGNFLQKDLTDVQVGDLVNHLSFEKMKENMCVHKESMEKMLNENAKTNFFRKGEVGDWKNYLTEEMNRRMDEKIKQCFEGTGLGFRYE